MKRKIVALLLGLFCCVVYAAVGPQPDQSPHQVIQAASDALLAELKAKKEAINANPQQELFKIVKATVLPYIDVDGMVRATLGRVGNREWSKAPADERQTFIDEFTKLIVGTYAAALKEYDDQTVKIFPVRGLNKSMTRVQVESEIITHGNEPVHIFYTLVKNHDTWYVHDFSVEGISLVSSYQAQFQSILDQKGLKGLIKTLEEHNKANEDT